MLINFNMFVTSVIIRLYFLIIYFIDIKFIKILCMNIREEIKVGIARRGTTLKKVSEELSKRKKQTLLL